MVLLILDLLLVLLDVALGNGSLGARRAAPSLSRSADRAPILTRWRGSWHGRPTAVAYILTLPVMIALCMETGLRAFALGSVLLSAPYLAAAELGITWLGAGLFFGLPQVRMRCRACAVVARPPP